MPCPVGESAVGTQSSLVQACSKASPRMGPSLAAVYAFAVVLGLGRGQCPPVMLPVAQANLRLRPFPRAASFKSFSLVFVTMWSSHSLPTTTGALRPSLTLVWVFDFALQLCRRGGRIRG